MKTLILIVLLMVLAVPAMGQYATYERHQVICVWVGDTQICREISLDASQPLGQTSRERRRNMLRFERLHKFHRR